MGNVSSSPSTASDSSHAIRPGLDTQGAKAQQKRERNAAKAGATAKSQLKVNEAAKNIICQTCRQTFVSYTTHLGFIR